MQPKYRLGPPWKTDAVFKTASVVRWMIHRQVDGFPEAFRTISELTRTRN
jgi:hypothetical protein